MFFSTYRNALAELRSLAPELGLARLLGRLVLWKACRIARLKPVIRLHSASRMRLHASAEERGIHTGIFLFHETYEPSVRTAIDRFVAQDSICYDIGANMGLWTLRMAEKAGPGGRIFAFEPNSRNLRCLRENLALSARENVSILPFALGDSERTAVLYIPHDAARSALAAETREDATEQVKVRRLDDCWEEQGRPAVSFLKLDVEGAEPLVLRGGGRFFDSVRPVTCCEVNPGKLRNMGYSPQDVLQPFRDWGYRPFVWDPRGARLTAFDLSAATVSTVDLVWIPAHDGFTTA